MSNMAIAHAELDAIDAIDAMDNFEVLKYVDSKTVCCHEMTMSQYRQKAIDLMIEEKTENVQ